MAKALGGLMKPKFFFCLSLFFICLFLSNPSHSSNGTIVGEGAIPCEKYLSMHIYKKNNFIIWLQGYVSAYNNFSSKTGDVIGAHDYHWVQQWLDNYCGKNPKKYFSEAVVALTDELSAK
jgi:hypothetical protein